MMLTTDPLADMLTRIRNANMAKHATVSIPASVEKQKIAEILAQEGYIASFEVTGEKVTEKSINVTLKYDGKGDGIIQGLKRVSKPGLRVYATCEKLPKVISGLGIAIISTNKGIITDKEARKLNVGGEVLAYVW